jgi:maltokinase
VTPGYHEQLAAYFTSRRWFAGKGRTFTITHVHAMPWLTSEQPRVRIEIVTVEFEDGTKDSYQFPVAYLLEPDPRWSHALVGPVEHDELGLTTAYDAVYIKPAADAFLRAFHERLDDGAVVFHVVENAELPGDEVFGTVMTAEQSNTSIAYGDDAILKLFRRVSAGGNPDIEIHEALTHAGAEHVAPLRGWISGVWSGPDGEPAHGDLGMLQLYLRTATDGWDIALASVRDLLIEEDLHPDEVGGDFAGEAERLGEATASVHARLAEIFGLGMLTEEQQAALAESMYERLRKARVIVPEIDVHADGLERHFERLRTLASAVAVQRIHGDLHLGQTLRTVKGWKLIDFEGEPAKSLPERAAMDSTLRDVAGMMRSFGYAAGATLQQFGESEQLSYRADEWVTRNRSAFLQGYFAAAAGDDAQRALLLAYEADKAVYEAVYETRNRPSWVSIPLQAIHRLAVES